MVSICVYSDHDAGVCFLFLLLKWLTVAILEGAVDRIGRKDLDFTVSYASEDEMGRLCASFEEMRKSLEENQKEMWKLVEDQKQLNAAFAHDLRTPLTVIRGYSDFLVRYLPKGTISQEKLKDTLGLLAEQCGRLEALQWDDEIPPFGGRDSISSGQKEIL